LRDLATDLVVGRRLPDAFEIALELLTILLPVRFAAGAIRRRFSAAFPATAPTNAADNRADRSCYATNRGSSDSTSSLFRDRRNFDVFG
jgi:hypothetical protein